MAKILDRQIIRHFQHTEHFDRETLYAFLLELDPDITKSALYWRANDLVKREVLEQVKRGVYAISQKKVYTPLVSEKLGRLSRIVNKEFDGLDYCIWSTEWLNDFTRHQLGSFFYILEVEKDFLEEVFNAYTVQKQYRVYLNPDEEIMERYMGNDVCLVIKPLISRSPKQTTIMEGASKSHIHVPTLEKILVDIYSDPVTFYAVQGGEMDTLFENALKRYRLNFTKLLSYARRRSKYEPLTEYLQQNFSELTKDILV